LLAATSKSIDSGLYSALTTQKRFVSLIDAIAKEYGPTALSPDAAALELLGPCVGDDAGLPSPSAAASSSLGPSVGDDGLAPLSLLGASVGDDGLAPLTVLGPSVGDDTPVSDLRLNEDVRCIGSTVFGLPLYHFKYLGSHETYEGVMAQDVMPVMPSAVSIGADGYYRVNYGALRNEHATPIVVFVHSRT
jgi:hypothetical protein